jgi:hypothetical protein
MARDISRNLIPETRHLVLVLSFLGITRWNREAALRLCALEASSGGPLVALETYKSMVHVEGLGCCTYFFFSLLVLLQLTSDLNTSLSSYALL